jgi:hypothetical protein
VSLGNVPAGGACVSDDDCAIGTYCDEGRCVKLQRPFNALYLYYRSGDRRFTEILGIYWHQRGDEGYRVLFPLYWHFWEPSRRTRVIFPFYARHRDDGALITSTFVLNFQYRFTPRERNYRFWPLVMWTDYGERGSGLTVLPIFHRAREGTRTSTVIPLFLSGYNIDPATGLSQGMVAGLYYWHRHGDFSSRAVVPLFYHRRSPRRSFTWVLPLIFHSRHEDRRSLWVLPFGGYGGDSQSATALFLTPPLYYRRHKQHARLYALPFFVYRRDFRDSLFIGGPVYRGGWPGGSSFGVFPLLFTRSERDRAFQVLFPVYWHFRSPDRSFTLAGPIFHRRRGPRSTTGLFPVALHHHDRKAGNRMAFVLPLFYYDSVDHYLRSRLITPLFLYERDTDAQVRHWGLLAPPFYSRRDPDREVDTLIPLLLRWHDKIERSTTWVVGPVVLNSDPEGGSQVAFPLFWRFRDARTGATTSLLFPLAYRHRRPDGSHLNIFFPFYYGRRARSWSAGLLPLVHAGASPDRGHMVVFPVFWHVKRPSGSVTSVVGPIFHRRDAKGWMGGLAPLLFFGNHGGTRWQVLFPAAWHLSSQNEGYHTAVLGSAFWTRGRHGTAYGLLPLYAGGVWKGLSFQTVVPPIFYYSRHQTTGDGSTIFLTYYGWRRGDVKGHLVLPLFYYRRDRSSLRTAVLPLFYYRRRPTEQMLVTPAGGFRRDAASGRLDAVAGPIVVHRGPTARGFAVIPLLMHWKRPQQQSSTTVLLPLGVHHRSPHQVALVGFPILWRFRDADQSSLVLFPFCWHVRQQRGLSFDVAFPVVWSFRSSSNRRVLVAGPVFRDRSESRTLTGAFPLGLYRRDGRGSLLLTLPFFYYRHKFEPGERTYLFPPFYARTYRTGHALGLLPLIFHKWTPERRYSILAPVFWYTASPNESRRLVVAGPFFARKHADVHQVGLAPIFYTAWDRLGSRSLAVLPIFYARREVARTAVYTLAGGYDRSPLRTQWYAATYFQRSSPGSSLDLFVPLFLRHRNHLQGRTTLLMPPLYYGQWSADRAFHLFFPVVWRYRRVDQAGTVVFPLFWDFNDRYATRTTLALPLFIRHRNHTARTTSWVLPPGIWVRTKPEAFDAVVFPVLWHFGSARSSSTVGFPLYWDFKSQNGRTTLLIPLLLHLDRPAHRTHVVLNTYYRRDKKTPTWRFIFLPLVDVNRERPKDIQVDILGGLFGYERVGRNRLLKIFFYSFPISPAKSATAGAGRPRRSAALRR